MLNHQVRPAKYVLTEAKHVILDSLLGEIKKLKEHFVQVEDERQLATSCLSDLQVLYDNLVDKPLQTQYAINYLNSGTITQLQFERIQDRIDLIAWAKKYIIKEKMLQNTTAKAKYMFGRVGDFRIISRNIFEHGLPNFLDEQGMFLS